MKGKKIDAYSMLMSRREAREAMASLYESILFKARGASRRGEAEKEFLHKYGARIGLYDEIVRMAGSGNTIRERIHGIFTEPSAKKDGNTEGKNEDSEKLCEDSEDSEKPCEDSEKPKNILERWKERLFARR